MRTVFLVKLRGAWTRLAREQNGQGLAEYALILAGIAVVAVVVLAVLGKDISSILSSVASNL
jgi:pilus assembly protein Flp/PilA